MLQGHVSKSTISNWNRKQSHAPRQTTKTTTSTVDFVAQALKNDPFLTAKQLKTMIENAKGFSISLSSVRTCIRKAGFTYKKARYIVCKEGLDDIRLSFAKHVINNVDPETVISIDETSIEYDSPPICGYSKRGQRLTCKTRMFNRKRWSVLMAVSVKGIVDTWMIEGSIDSDVFSRFVLTLQDKGFQHLMMDNASIHKSKSVLNACERAKLNPLYLPAYTPWFQPIEHCFSVLKHHLQKMSCRQNIPCSERMGIMGRRIANCIDSSDLGSGASFNKCWARMLDWVNRG